MTKTDPKMVQKSIKSKVRFLYAMQKDVSHCMRWPVYYQCAEEASSDGLYTSKMGYSKNVGLVRDQLVHYH